ncbi:MAG TPA: NHL repeat-containing protein [Longimicrobium sp.]|uniref:NHL repeat-containing protein n=1 Tax=Longimicrobium sp. TaxID=2029185 RepID=UPI002ED8D885
MPTPLRCPTCSGPLDTTATRSASVRCPYCGADALLTDRLGAPLVMAEQSPGTDAAEEIVRLLREGNRYAAVEIYRARHGGTLHEAVNAIARIEAQQPPGTVPAPPSLRRGALTVAAVTALAVAGILVIMNGSAEPAAAPASFSGPAVPRITFPAPPVPDAPAEWAETVTRFGAEGTGAGRFDDARWVALDGSGRIYVAEYSGGRVQVFDSAGTFQTQWTADPDMPMQDMAADRGGTVYVVQRGAIRRYEGATGTRLDDVAAPRSASFKDVAVALDGTLWALEGWSRLMHLSRTGAVLASHELKTVVGDDDVWAERVAVAGDGRLYVLDQRTGEVYRLTPEGRFVDRFGGRGEGAGSLQSPMDLAVDGRGRVYVSDSGIQVFDPEGRHLGGFGGHAAIFGLAISDRDDLFASDRNAHQIARFRLPAPTP